MQGDVRGMFAIGSFESALPPSVVPPLPLNILPSHLQNASVDSDMRAPGSVRSVPAIESSHRRQRSASGLPRPNSKLTKSTIDLSQLLPERLPNANQDVMSVNDLRQLGEAQGIRHAVSRPSNPSVLETTAVNEGNPAHPRHPGNFTPNQMSPASSTGGSPDKYEINFELIVHEFHHFFSFSKISWHLSLSFRKSAGRDRERRSTTHAMFYGQYDDDAKSSK